MGNGEASQDPKKGLSNWAWIGIGCAAVLLIGIIAVGSFVWWGVGKAKDMAADFEANPGLAAARLIVKASPELEEVAVDEDAGTITVRNTSTGEEITVNFEDVKEGRLSFTSGDREVTLEASEDGEGGAVVNITGSEGELRFSTGDRVAGERPEWVPLYPGCEPTNQHVMTRDEGISGGFQLTTDDPVDGVAEFYRERLTDAGFEISVTTFSGDGEKGAMVTCTDEAGGRTVVVNARSEGDETLVGVTYNEGD